MAGSKRRRVTMSDLDHRLRELTDRLSGRGIILEEIRSQYRATIDAVEAARVALEARIDQFDRDSRAREDIRVLTARVEALGPLDQRVSALERRFGEG